MDAIPRVATASSCIPRKTTLIWKSQTNCLPYHIDIQLVPSLRIIVLSLPFNFHILRLNRDLKQKRFLLSLSFLTILVTLFS